VAFRADASCYHQLCVEQQEYSPEITNLTITDWDGYRMSFKFYAYNANVSGLTIKSQGRSYDVCDGFVSAASGACDGSITTREKGWGSGWVELPQYDPKASFIFDKACRCVEYREPTMLEKLKGFEKPPYAN
jgi:hypothetical protein